MLPLLSESMPIAGARQRLLPARGDPGPEWSRRRNAGGAMEQGVVEPARACVVLLSPRGGRPAWGAGRTDEYGRPTRTTQAIVRRCTVPKAGIWGFPVYVPNLGHSWLPPCTAHSYGHSSHVSSTLRYEFCTGIRLQSGTPDTITFVSMCARPVPIHRQLAHSQFQLISLWYPLGTPMSLTANRHQLVLSMVPQMGCNPY